MDETCRLDWFRSKMISRNDTGSATGPGTFFIFNPHIYPSIKVDVTKIFSFEENRRMPAFRKHYLDLHLFKAPRTIQCQQCECGNPAFITFTSKFFFQIYIFSKYLDSKKYLQTTLFLFCEYFFIIIFYIVFITHL